MDIKTDLDSLDNLIDRLRTYAVVDTGAEWAAAQATLDRLKADAKRLGLPWGLVSQYATSLKDHLGVILGAFAPDGHSREQHLSWAIGDMSKMHSEHAFGPALDRLNQSPSGSLH